MSEFYKYVKENMDALGRSLAGGTSLADVLLTAKKNNLDRDWPRTCLHLHPGIYKADHPGRILAQHWRYTV